MVRRHQQRGAVSLFVVIFSALLITVVTLSFIRLMVKDQQEASDSDLSQSAYDSAMSGVEDAKRAILKQQTVCGANPTSQQCVQLTAAMASQKCTTLSDMGITGLTQTTTGGNKEVLIQSAGGGSSTTNQAYTCVKIALDTPDYLGTLKAGASNIVPLSTVSDNVQSVELSWFTYGDFSSVAPSASRTVSLESNAAMPLYAAGGSTTNVWPQNRPSLVRAQLVQFSDTSGFNLSDFDSGGDASTLFLYPSNVGTASTSFTNDSRRDASSGSLQPVKCNASLVSQLYACTATITLPNPVQGGAAHRLSYLRLSSLYNGMHYTIKLKNAAGNYIDFHGVQPSVDSTGRANDLFRRVQSRIELTSNFPYPEAAVDVTGGVCKTFQVTANASDYNPGACGVTDTGGTVVPPAGGAGGVADFVLCSSVTCPTGGSSGSGSTTNISWEGQFKNTSNNPPESIDRCTWDFDDGGARGDPSPIQTTACNYGDTIDHIFYPNKQTPPYTCETYTVTLTVYLKGGLQKQKSLVTHMPWGAESPC